jgi:hypothetical protein
MNHPTRPVVPAQLRQTRLLVLAWTRHFLGESFLHPVAVENPGGEDITLEFTTDRMRIGEADAIWFHGPTIEDLPPKRPGQRWIMMSMESAANYPNIASPLLQRFFEITMTYRLDSDVPCVYPSWREYGSFRRMNSADGMTRGACLYIASNPVRHRDDYVRELMRHIPVDCLGRCLNNHRIEGFVTGSDRWARGGLQSILPVLDAYPFYLAFENSIAEDYVTEKVFHALATGAVPVYRGAPNVREFMPHDDAVIAVADFDSPAHLAEYLRHVQADADARRGHLAWKQRDHGERFRRIVDLGNVDSRARLAVKLAHGCGRECRCGGRLR